MERKTSSAKNTELERGLQAVKMSTAYLQTLHIFSIIPDEALCLEFGDVTIVDDEDLGKTIPEIEVRGKRGVGYCKSMPGAVRSSSMKNRPLGGIMFHDGVAIRH
jgi:hypothetical protein